MVNHGKCRITLSLYHTLLKTVKGRSIIKKNITKDKIYEMNGNKQRKEEKKWNIENWEKQD